ncbi:MAG: hypothetical protein NTW54_12550 [Bacteroidetes bacterium]|nr:hypothetical protein [Bacteroidota bacterium]
MKLFLEDECWAEILDRAMGKALHQAFLQYQSAVWLEMEIQAKKKNPVAFIRLNIFP